MTLLHIKRGILKGFQPMGKLTVLYSNANSFKENLSFIVPFNLLSTAASFLTCFITIQFISSAYSNLDIIV